MVKELLRKCHCGGDIVSSGGGCGACWHCTAKDCKNYGCSNLDIRKPISSFPGLRWECADCGSYKINMIWGKADDNSNS